MDNTKRFDPDSHYAVEMLPPKAYTHHIKRKYLNISYADISLKPNSGYLFAGRRRGTFSCDPFDSRRRIYGLRQI